mmetsp:Transcript_15351/g.25950  ORF Transcript_15351/g.25950 Transcript_15351/m.25950 type:complete len:116 (+) Transcript_15351:867-1214(+)
MRNFYVGSGYYGLAYTLFISLEFALHDFLIEYIGELTGSKETSIFNLILEEEVKLPEEQEGAQRSSNHHHWTNELFASFAAGCVAALLTNGIETVAVNKQTNPKMTLREILFHEG